MIKTDVRFAPPKSIIYLYASSTDPLCFDTVKRHLQLLTAALIVRSFLKIPIITFEFIAFGEGLFRGNRMKKRIDIFHEPYFKRRWGLYIGSLSTMKSKVPFFPLLHTIIQMTTPASLTALEERLQLFRTKGKSHSKRQPTERSLFPCCF